MAYNASTWDDALWAIQKKFREELQFKVTIKQAGILLTRFKEQHHPIAKYFTSGFGLKAMWYDSLVIERCLENLLVGKGIPTYPIHDEVLTVCDHVDTAVQVMKQCYNEVMIQAIKSKCKSVHQYADDYFRPIIKVA